MRSLPRTITFDCYGTLIDAAGGRGGFLYAEQLRRGAQHLASGPQLAAKWADLQWEELQGGYRPYKQLVDSVCRRLAVDCGWEWSSPDTDRFVDATRALQPFGDVLGSLHELKQCGYRLGLMSNSDRDLIEHAVRQMDGLFDDVFVAEDCAAYKPSPRFFAYVAEALRAEPTEILHVANGFRYDMPPAKALGWQAAWLNRGFPAAAPQKLADHEWTTMAQLLVAAGSAACVT